MKSAFILIASQRRAALFNFPMIYNKPLFNNTRMPQVFIKNPQLRLIQLGRWSELQRPAAPFYFI